MRSRSEVVAIILAWCIALIAGACGPDGCGRAQVNNGTGEEPVQILFAVLEQEVVLPTSVLSLRVLGSERVVAGSILVDIEGNTNTREVRQALEVTGAERGLRFERTDGDTGELLVLLPVDEGLWAAFGEPVESTFTGTITLTVRDVFGDVVGEARVENVSLSLKDGLRPEARQLGGAGVQVHVGQRIPLGGAGFLRPEEGRSVARVTSGSLEFTDGTTRDVAGAEVPMSWTGERASAALVIAPTIFGVRQATFTGDVEFVNILRNGSERTGNAQAGLVFELQRSFIATLTPERGSRGQLIGVNGRGLIETAGGAGMTLRFEGTFKPQGFAAIELTGEDALERVPDRVVSDELVEVAVWSEVVQTPRGPQLEGLGALPGFFEGTITPVLFDPLGGTQQGVPWSGRFQVLGSKQVVYLKYLPRFSSALDKYGLRNVETEVRQRILEVAQAPYAEVNVEFRDELPADFVEFTTVELSGPDPYGNNAFGYDNSFNGNAKDTGNLFLSDYIGGVNVDSLREFANPFGGIYIESFDFFSAELSAARNGGNPGPGSSEAFDRIMGPFMPALGGEPVLATEWPDGPRASEIRRAIDMFGHVVGDTLAHEVGHSMGLSYFPEDDIEPGSAFHNDRPTPGDAALMDAGSERPFEERAAIDGTPPARFNQRNLEYLKRILPK